jgi:tetratricopeptide (TPR) repeat protein
MRAARGTRAFASIAGLTAAALMSLAAAGETAPKGRSPQDDPETLMARAMNLYRSRDYNAAAALFLGAAGRLSDPSEARYYAGKSLLYGSPTDLAGAEAQFLLVVKAKPSLVDGLIALGQVYYEWGRYEKARERLGAALALSPGHRGALYYSGVISARLGEYEKALSYLKAASEADPSYHAARVEMGLALAHLDRYEEAIAAYEQVLSAEPENTRALMGLGTALDRAGRREEAKDVLSKFRKVAAAKERDEMKEMRVNLWLGQIRKAYDLGRMDDARRSAGRLLEEYPEEPRGLASLGYLQDRAGESSAAIATYEKVLKLQPDNLTANFELIALYVRSGQGERAKAQRARYDELRRRAAERGSD